MNASMPINASAVEAEPDISRRHFLRGLLGQQSPAKEQLAPVKTQCDRNAVLWALCELSDASLAAAGDDGSIGVLSDIGWRWQVLPGAHNVHALCSGPAGDFAVGWKGAIYQHLDGEWTLMQGGGDEAARENWPLFDIVSDGVKDCWAVGDQGRVCRYDGNAWQELDVPTNANLRCALRLSDSDLLVGGLGGTLLRFDGQAWTDIHTDSASPLVSMAELPDGAVLIAGGDYDVDSGRFRGRLFLLQDDELIALDTPADLPRLRHLSYCSGQLLICGDDGFACRWTETGIEPLHNNARYDLHSAIVSQDTSWLCGDQGSLFRLERCAPEELGEQQIASAGWRVLSRESTTYTLRTLLAINENTLIAAGDAGQVAHIESESIRWEQTPAQLRIHSLWASSPRNIYASCDAGTILHYDGYTWETVHRGNPGNALLAIKGFGPHDIFAVGDNGYALRYDGLMWRELDTGTRQELYGLWGQDSDHLLAVGGGGLVLRWNGSHWKSFHAGTHQDLYGVAGAGLSQLLLCGLAGTLISFDGTAWQREFSGTRADLHAVSLREGHSFCVGSNGTVLYKSPNQFDWTQEAVDCDNTLQAIVATDAGTWAVGSMGTIIKRP